MVRLGKMNDDVTTVYKGQMHTFIHPSETIQWRELHPPLGISIEDFLDICTLAETNVTMYEALERLKVIYELTK